MKLNRFEKVMDALNNDDNQDTLLWTKVERLRGRNSDE